MLRPLMSTKAAAAVAEVPVRAGVCATALPLHTRTPAVIVRKTRLMPVLLPDSGAPCKTTTRCLAPGIDGLICSSSAASVSDMAHLLHFLELWSLPMPEQATLKRARQDKRAGKAPSTQAGEFVREEIHHVREGKHGARSTKQAIAIGLSKARRAGVKLPRPPASAKASTKRSAEKAARTRTIRLTARRRRAVS